MERSICSGEARRDNDKTGDRYAHTTVASMPDCKLDRRNDIQGLRAIAIIAVLFFHIWPECFSYGYLGVDMFFVISGFLMVKILSSGSTPASPTTLPAIHSNATSTRISKQPYPVAAGKAIREEGAIAQLFTLLSMWGRFYSRRIRRILPMYLIMLLTVLLISPLVLMNTDMAVLRGDLLWALGFASNMQSTLGAEAADRKGYFALLNTPRLLTHAWSLGVEVQFYLFVPAVVLLAEKIGSACLFLKYSYLGAMMTASRLLQALSPSDTAFGLMPCRVWEFLAGALAFYIGEEPWDDSKRCWVKSTLMWMERHFPARAQSYTAMLVATATLLVPCVKYTFPFTQLYQSVVVALAAFMLLPRHRSRVGVGNALLRSRAAVGIGDASYVCYLLHWPLLQWVKYVGCIEEFGLLDGLAMLFIALAIAYFVHSLVDSVIQKEFQQWRPLFLLVGLLYAINGGLIASVLLAIKVPAPDLSLRVFHFEPIPTWDYGRRFNDALDSGAISSSTLATLPLAERIVINQRMERDSMAYTDAEVGGIWSGPEHGLSMAQLLEIQARPEQWRFRVSHRGLGNSTMLLVGNSHADHIAGELRREWRSHYSVLNIFTIDICLPLDIDYGWPRINGERCEAYARAVQRLVESMKPDILFINFLWDVMAHGRPHVAPIPTPVDKDTIQTSLQAAISSLEVHVGRTIFLGAPNLHFVYPVSHELTKRQWLNVSLAPMNIGIKEHVARVLPYLTRLHQLHCEKCVIVEWTEAFCSSTPVVQQKTTSAGGRGHMGGGKDFGIFDSGSTTRAANFSIGSLLEGRKEEEISEKESVETTCYAYDPRSQLAYFTDRHHYSYLGARAVRPILRHLLAV